MNIRRTATAVTLAATVALTGAGCSKRQIDANTTDSTKIPGTSWWRMCDGNNAIFWVEGAAGDADEIEMVIYDHWACVPEGTAPAEDGSHNGPEADPDGIVEDEN